MSGSGRKRLDQRMVDLGLAPSRARAQAMIEQGIVEIAGRPANKSSDRGSGAITLNAEPDPWVSRAALKLLHALDHFNLTPAGVAIDVGASTGGFTQVLLARGAELVHAVDVGHGQLDAVLASDPRVANHEGINARALTPGQLPAVDWITADVSFISLEKVLPPALSFAKPAAWIVALIKPQFEAGPRDVGKRGIVRASDIHDRVCRSIETFLLRQNWRVEGVVPSPISGSDGNREFLIAAQKL